MRLGIFGGTFDPPHLGHLILAEEARYRLNLERLLWLLTPISPFKTRVGISSWEQRLELLQAAIADNPGFEISRVDIDRPAPHYAFESVKLIRDQHPEAELVYLLGGDSLRDLPTWEQPEELLAQVDQVGVMRRPDIPVDLEQLLTQLPGLASRLTWVNAPLIDISGRTIRKNLREGAPVRYYLTEAVLRIIQEKNLYQVISGDNAGKD